MMTLTSPHKGHTSKTANVHNAPDQKAAIDFAMSYFNETPERLYDWAARTDSEGVVVVTLWTD